MKIFDFHFHLLFKHYLHDKQDLPVGANLRLRGIVKGLNDIFGGPFTSQSSPAIISGSSLQLGVIGILALEHAFANRVLHVWGIDVSGGLPVDWDLFRRIKNGEISYYEDFKSQVAYYVKHSAELGAAPYHIHYLDRRNYKGKSREKLLSLLAADGKKYMTFSIEGGHNLSDVPVRRTDAKSLFPERQLKDIQDNSPLDFISINLCHLSDIPEQQLGSFAQGVTSISQIAFSSEDFMPRQGLGLTGLGKKVIKQALTHQDRPLLIDTKHMSLYTRLDFYKYRRELIQEHSDTGRLPIVCSHSGFTFRTVKSFMEDKLFASTEGTENGTPVSTIRSRNIRIGSTGDWVNTGLFGNPWTINLFDEDIIEIMQSGGLIGISLDQRILGAGQIAINSLRGKHFESEYIPRGEWEKLFRDGEFPEAKVQKRGLWPGRREIHIMVFCIHIVYAVRVGYRGMNWENGKSPWDHICLGSDYDGLINPINGFDTAADLDGLAESLKQNLPKADRLIDTSFGSKALRYNPKGQPDETYLEEVIRKFLYGNGRDFMIRFLMNWH